MNVIISNKYHNELDKLNIDIIKSVSGVFEVNDIVEMFKNFFFEKMILDVTALKHYDDYLIYQKLVNGLEANKIVFFIPEGSNLCTSNFLGHLISFGIYNFTSNINGIYYLLKKSNSYEDVENIAKMANISSSKDTGAAVVTNSGSDNGKLRIIGFQNVTPSAGASTLIYMIKKELSSILGNGKVVACEIRKNDFPLFYEKDMYSISENELQNFVQKYSDCKFILVDLNDCEDVSFCNDVIYLIEPSTIKLSRILLENKNVFSSLFDKKVILNQSLLLNNDVFDFEKESGIKILYNMPPLDERKKNAIISDFITRLGLLNSNDGNGSSNKIFGLFRR